MKNLRINFRLSNLKDDINKISEYIYETDMYIYPTIINDNEKEEWINIISQCFKDEENIFYYKNLLVVEVDNEIQGILCIIQGGKEYHFSKNINYSNDLVNKIQIVEKGYFKPLIVENLLIEGINIINLCIDEKYRHQGLGQQLLSYCFSLFPNQKCTLDVIKDNIPAVNLYLKNGFIIEKEYDGFSGKKELIKCLKMVRY